MRAVLLTSHPPPWRYCYESVTSFFLSNQRFSLVISMSPLDGSGIWQKVTEWNVCSSKLKAVLQIYEYLSHCQRYTKSVQMSEELDTSSSERMADSCAGWNNSSGKRAAKLRPLTPCDIWCYVVTENRGARSYKPQLNQRFRLRFDARDFRVNLYH